MVVRPVQGIRREMSMSCYKKLGLSAAILRPNQIITFLPQHQPEHFQLSAPAALDNLRVLG